MYLNVSAACEVGYTGPNCHIECPFPMYGKDCQSMCNCSDNVCDHIRGCKRLLTSNISYLT